MIDSRFRVEPAAWRYDQDALRAVREQVFIVEQRVPAEEEWDALDPLSYHVLARDAQDRPVGTGRLTPDRHIGRIAVLSEWRGRGVGLAIMRALLDRAAERGDETVELHAQDHAIAFYEALGFAIEGEGFEECGIPHHRMWRTLAPPAHRPAVAAPAPPPPRIYDCRERGDTLAAVRDLIGSARHELAILTRDLDPALFDQPDVLEQIKRIALSGPRARIRIAIQDPAVAMADGHRLVALAQRLPSAIALRTPVEDIDRQLAAAFLLTDGRGFLYRPLASRFEAEGASYAPGRHAQLWARFDTLWERCAPADELRRLSL
ncbi:GNAT family N-acetyltransferase [Dokdonella koreensis]|uniref:GCN5-related N-acetyltransferase n=1 Tax=Dokdonella koreensis DS-123 TaxID=1300342 RepID=A0A167H0C0_9GAMM|nr:GNAT family N-acetyltransferase [Dokdonella koreensis]ANB18356.1 GCN5-related N-acetyltransferase [Dokdonella koreensis DS-123]